MMMLTLAMVIRKDAVLTRSMLVFVSVLVFALVFALVFVFVFE